SDAGLPSGSAKLVRTCSSRHNTELKRAVCRHGPLRRSGSYGTKRPIGNSTAWGGIMMKFPGITRRITIVLAAAAMLLGIPAAAASASSATTGTGWIRLAHLSPNTPAVDVYLYSFGNSDAKIVLHHVAYGTVSPYEAVTAGDYSVAMRAAGASA